LKAWELGKANSGEEPCATYRPEIGQVYLLQGIYDKALDHLLAEVRAYEQRSQHSIIQPYPATQRKNDGNLRGKNLN